MILWKTSHRLQPGKGAWTNRPTPLRPPGPAPERLISTKLPPQYDAAVTMLRDLQELAQHEDQAQAFARRFTALREAHLREPSLIARFDRAGLTL